MLLGGWRRTSGSGARGVGRHRRPRRAAGLALVVTSVALLGSVGTTPATAAPSDAFTDGQWYADAFHLARNHKIADGSGVTVAVLDGAIDPGAPSLAGADVVPQRRSPCVNRHGTHDAVLAEPDADHATGMTAMIAGQGGHDVPLGAAPGAKVLTYAIGFSTAKKVLALRCPLTKGAEVTHGDDTAGDAIRDAVAKGARIINMSYGGRHAAAATQVAIQYAERKGVVFVASTDDYKTTLTRVIPPGSFNGVVLVNAIDRRGKQASYSAKGDPDGPLVVASAPGVDLSLGSHTADGRWVADTTVGGSSPATAFVTGVLATTLSHWPKATGNQLIQSLARNTGGNEHGLGRRALDGYGYGVVSLSSMLQHDPTRYPDVNPTLRDGAQPSTDEIYGTTPSASPSAQGAAASAPDAKATDTDRQTGSSVGLVVAVVAAVAVLLALAAAFVLVRRRRAGASPPPTA